MATQEDKAKALAAALGQIEKQFGKGSIMKLVKLVSDVEAVSTGSLSLDAALGIGGPPRDVLLKSSVQNLQEKLP